MATKIVKCNAGKIFDCFLVHGREKCANCPYNEAAEKDNQKVVSVKSLAGVEIANVVRLNGYKNIYALTIASDQDSRQTATINVSADSLRQLAAQILLETMDY